MKTKKIVIAVLTAALLISVLLIAGCYDQIRGGLPGKDTEDTYPIPPKGKGIVRLKIVDQNARTILPHATPLGDMVYDLEVTDQNALNLSPTNITQTKITYGKISTDFSVLTLEDGTYEISIIAYIASESVPDSGVFDVFTPIASWNNNNATFTVNSGVSETLVAVLKPNTTTGTGTFVFNISPSSNGTTIFDILTYGSTPATITNSYPGYALGETYVFPKTLSASTGDDHVTLNSGYYYVKVTSTLANYQTIEYIHVLHIYANMTSTMDSLSMPTLVQNKFVVTYNLNNVDDESHNYTNNETESVFYGNYAVKGGTVEPENDNYTFNAWSTTQSGTYTAWVFNANRVLQNETLYARWTADGTPLGISFTIQEKLTVSTNTLDISRASIFGAISTPTVIKLTATNPTDNLSDIKWSTSNVDISSKITSDDETDDTLTIDNDQIFWQLLSTNHSFPINVEAKVNGTGYSGQITVNVGN